MTPLKSAALRFEMACGRVSAMSGGGAEVDIGEAQELVDHRDAERRAFHQTIEEHTGMSAGELARLLAL